MCLWTAIQSVHGTNRQNATRALADAKHTINLGRLYITGYSYELGTYFYVEGGVCLWGGGRIFSLTQMGEGFLGIQEGN